MTVQPLHLAQASHRRIADLVLFGFTGTEFVALILLTSDFTIVEWIYVLQNLLVLGIALTRHPPIVQDSSLPTAIAVAVSITYPYAQVICLLWADGYDGWPTGGFILVALAAPQPRQPFIARPVFRLPPGAPGPGDARRLRLRAASDVSRLFHQ